MTAPPQPGSTPAGSAPAGSALPSPGRFRQRLYAAALGEVERRGGGEEAVGWVLRHGLLALEDHPRLPAALRPPLAAAARRNLAANLLRIHRFQAVADRLAPLPVCPLKGIHLLDRAYAADPQHRVMADLDLLLRPEDVEEAVDRLEGLGYREGAASRRAAPWWHERVLDDGQVTLEIHLRLGLKHGPRTAWEDVAPEPARVHGRLVHALDDATTLVHLVVHFVKHGPFVRLGWVEDVLRWVEERAAGADGEGAGGLGGAAWEVARRLGAGRSFVAGVRALDPIAGDGFLPTVPRRPGGTGGVLLALHERHLWPALPRDPLACGTASTAWRRNLSALLLADRPADALRFLAAKARELASRR